MGPYSTKRASNIDQRWCMDISTHLLYPLLLPPLRFRIGLPPPLSLLLLPPALLLLLPLALLLPLPAPLLVLLLVRIILIPLLLHQAPVGLQRSSDAQLRLVLLVGIGASALLRLLPLGLLPLGVALEHLLLPPLHLLLLLLQDALCLQPCLLRLGDALLLPAGAGGGAEESVRRATLVQHWRAALWPSILLHTNSNASRCCVLPTPLHKHTPTAEADPSTHDAAIALQLPAQSTFHRPACGAASPPPARGAAAQSHTCTAPPP